MHMSPFAKLMSRFGWIRLSSYGLELSLDGRLVPAGSCTQHSLELGAFVPPAGLDLAATFDPALAPVPAKQLMPPAPPTAKPRTLPLKAPSQAPTARKALPPLPRRQEVTQSDHAEPTQLHAQSSVQAPKLAIAQTSVQEEMSEEEEWAWQAAVARAKANAEEELTQCETQIARRDDSESDEDMGFADTAPLHKDEVESEKTEVAQEAQAPEEDWELLVQAARERAHESEQTYADTQIVSDPRAEPDFAAAQVETSAKAANDDLPAASVTSIHAIKLRPLAAQQSKSDDDEWVAMRTQIELKEHQESARKMRAMREIRRLQGRAPHEDFVRAAGSPPSRRRLAAGTAGPIATSQDRAQPLMLLRRDMPSSSETTSGDATRVDLPRVTERLSR